MKELRVYRVFSRFYLSYLSFIQKNVNEITICFTLNSTIVHIFHSLEVVDRGSETQLQVGENLNYLAQHIKG